MAPPRRNVRTDEYKHISFTVWDGGDQDKIRALSKMPVRDRVEDAQEELNGINLEAVEYKNISFSRETTILYNVERV